MRLGDFFSDLSYGVLSTLSIGGDGTGTIPDGHHAQLVSLTNMGLQALHRRFHLIESEVVIRTYSDLTLYPLRKIHADTDSTTGVRKFIADSIQRPFLEDVAKILGTYDEIGTPIPLNDKDASISLWTPSYDTIQIPGPEDDGAVFILYRANHAKLSPGPIGGPADLNQEITLPATLTQALAAYVAYLVLSPKVGQEMSGKGAEQFQIYESICAEVESQDLASTSDVENHSKLQERGFV